MLITYHKCMHDITLLPYISYEDVPQSPIASTLSSDPYHISPDEVCEFIVYI